MIVLIIGSPSALRGVIALEFRGCLKFKREDGGFPITYSSIGLPTRKCLVSIVLIVAIRK